MLCEKQCPYCNSTYSRGCNTPKQETPEETPQKADDYEAIRALIQEYERRIDELEQMLPENQVENNNKQSESEYVQI